MRLIAFALLALAFTATASASVGKKSIEICKLLGTGTPFSGDDTLTRANALQIDTVPIEAAPLENGAVDEFRKTGNESI